MALKDKHDSRTFRHYAKLSADGSITALVEVAETDPPPADHANTVFIDITDLQPMDLAAVAIDRAHLDAITTAKRAIKEVFALAKAKENPDA